MGAEEEIREAVGELTSGTGPRPAFVTMGVMGPETPEEQIAALEGDIRKLLNGLLLAGRQIEDLRGKIVRS